MTVLWIAMCIGAFFLILVGRAVAFKPLREPDVDIEPVDVDEDAAVSRMVMLIRCRTVSYQDKSREDVAAFEDFPVLLQKLYPNLHAACRQERVGARGLLYCWRGNTSDHPSVLMAHYDVVPAQEERWKKPPFDANIEDDVLWGRGTLDTKGTMLGILEAAEMLIGRGFTPKNDLYISFGGDEETDGAGTRAIVEVLRNRGVSPAFVLDEGGAVVVDVFPGLKRPCALVGIAEKGVVNVILRAESRGGHASAPPPQTPVSVLARAVGRVEKRPFPFRLTPPAKAMFNTLGRHCGLPLRVVFANLWCFAPLLNLLCRKKGGEMNALVRTTCAFTQMRGSDAPNVLPPDASMGANVRIICGETVQSVKSRLGVVIHDNRVIVDTANGKNPSPVSSTTGEPWARLANAIAQTWPGAVLSPYLMVAASDSYYYAGISENVYRFSGMALSAEERAMIHGNDERVPLEKLHLLIEFYVRLIRGC